MFAREEGDETSMDEEELFTALVSLCMCVCVCVCVCVEKIKKMLLYVLI